MFWGRKHFILIWTEAKSQRTRCIHDISQLGVDMVGEVISCCETVCVSSTAHSLVLSFSVFHHLCDEDIDTECDNGLINPGRLSPGVAAGPGGADVPPVQIIALSNRLRILLCLTGKQQHLACLFPRGILNHICNDSRWRNLVKPCRCESS